MWPRVSVAVRVTGCRVPAPALGSRGTAAAVKAPVAGSTVAVHAAAGTAGDDGAEVGLGGEVHLAEEVDAGGAAGGDAEAGAVLGGAELEARRLAVGAHDDAIPPAAAGPVHGAGDEEVRAFDDGQAGHHEGRAAFALGGEGGGAAVDGDLGLPVGDGAGGGHGLGGGPAPGGRGGEGDLGATTLGQAGEGEGLGVHAPGEGGAGDLEGVVADGQGKVGGDEGAVGHLGRQLGDLGRVGARHGHADDDGASGVAAAPDGHGGGHEGGAGGGVEVAQGAAAEVEEEGAGEAGLVAGGVGGHDLELVAAGLGDGELGDGGGRGLGLAVEADDGGRDGALGVGHGEVEGAGRGEDGAFESGSGRRPRW